MICCPSACGCRNGRPRGIGNSASLVDSPAGPVGHALLRRGGNFTEGGHRPVFHRLLPRRLRRPCRRDSARCSVLAHRGGDLRRTPDARWHCSGANRPAVAAVPDPPYGALAPGAGPCHLPVALRRASGSRRHCRRWVSGECRSGALFDQAGSATSGHSALGALRVAVTGRWTSGSPRTYPSFA